MSGSESLPAWRYIAKALVRLIERGLLLGAGSIGILVWGLMGLRWMSDLYPLFELATHFSLHAWVSCVGLLIIQAVFYWLRRRSQSSGPRWRRRLIFVLIPFLFFTWVTTPWRLLPLFRQGHAERELKILSWNILLSNRNPEEILGLVKSEQPDVVVLIEVSPEMAKKLEALNSEYRFCSDQSAWHGGGMIVMSRLPGSEFETSYPGQTWMPAIQLKLPATGSGKGLHLLAVHTLSPRPGSDHRTIFRDRQLQDIATWAKGRTEPSVVIGDFNVTPWSPPFWRLLRNGELSDAGWYRGYFPSWPYELGRLAIPIDHGLVNRYVQVLHRSNWFGPSHSDHRPLILTIALP